MSAVLEGGLKSLLFLKNLNCQSSFLQKYFFPQLTKKLKWYLVCSPVLNIVYNRRKYKMMSTIHMFKIFVEKLGETHEKASI